MSNKTERNDAEAWENGALGRSEEHVAVVAPEECKAVDDSLGLQLVSIRLQKSLIANLKLVAGHHGIAYQPMIRDLLNRFVVSEMKIIMQGLVVEAERQQAEAGGEEGPVSEFLERERKRA